MIFRRRIQPFKSCDDVFRIGTEAYFVETVCARRTDIATYAAYGSFALPLSWNGYTGYIAYELERDDSKMINLRFLFRKILFHTLIVFVGLFYPTITHALEGEPAIWRKLARASNTVEELFLSRTPQIVIYGDGLIVYRDDDYKTIHQQVRLVGDGISELYLMMQNRFGLPSLTNDWLENELPYAQSIQEPFRENNDKVTIWIGLHSPPSLHTHTTGLLKSRSVNKLIAPAWNALYEFNSFLAGFYHPGGKIYIPDRVEIAVQKLPLYMMDQSENAVDWPIEAIDLASVTGKRPRGYRTMSGNPAREAYRLLTRHQVIRQDSQIYLVWIRPLLIP